MQEILVREVLGRSAYARVARNYTVKWIKHPDPGSIFERKTRSFRWLPGWVLILLLRAAGYDGLLSVDDKGVAGHAFYQKRGGEYHLFSIAVGEDRRRQGIGLTVLRGFLSHAWNDGIRRVRIGTGRNTSMEGLWQGFLNRRFNLPFTILSQGEGWVQLA